MDGEPQQKRENLPNATPYHADWGDESQTSRNLPFFGCLLQSRVEVERSCSIRNGQRCEVDFSGCQAIPVIYRAHLSTNAPTLLIGRNTQDDLWSRDLV